MKILLQNQYDDLLGGVETYFKLLSSTLIEKGHEVVTVYTQSGKKSNIQNNGYKAFYLPNLDLAENIYYSKKRQKEIKEDIDFLRSIVAKEKPDIIHLNNTYYPSQYTFLNKYAPIIQTVHDFFNCCNTLIKILPDSVCDKPLGKSCFRNKCVSPKSVMELWRFRNKYKNKEAMKSFERILVTTPYMKDMLVCNGFYEDRVQVIPLFVEDWKLERKSDKNIVIFIGRLAKEKGVIHFIHMLSGLSCDYKAFIIGDGPQRDECENLVDIMGIRDKVEFTGFLDRDEIKEYFLKASVVVIPSLWPEPFCMVGIEAMSFSKPVVAYNAGGISSWLRDNYNGYLAKRGDIPGLAYRVDTLLKHKKLAEDFGRNGRRLSEEKFSKNIHLDSLAAAYEEVILSRETAKKKIFNIKFPIVSQYKKWRKELCAKNILKHYPKQLPGESLPEYNKRLIKYEVENSISFVRSYPEEITISTTTRCNMHPPCVICERNLVTAGEGGDLEEGIFKKIKHTFKYADRIYLHCGGEPLITNLSFDIIESVGPPTKIIFNTNGALFTEKTIKYMVDCNVVDIISFSLDAATEKTYKKIRSADFNRIINNIDTLIKYRNKKNKDKPLLRPLVLMNFCIFKRNIMEVPDYVLLAYKLGADGIDFSHLNDGFDWQQKRKDYVFDYKTESVLHMENIEDHDKLILKAYELSKRYGVPINFNGNPFISKLDDNKTRIKSDISEVIKHKKICIAPWNRAVIETDGRVRMCYFHHNRYGIIGNLGVPIHKDTNLYDPWNCLFEEIWNGEKAVSVRKEFIEKSIAGRCITGNPCIFQDRI